MTQMIIDNHHRSVLLPAYMRVAEPPPRAYKPVRYELGYCVEGLPECVTTAHRTIQWWLNDILHGCTERRRWVTLYGRSGCGKTHLVTAACAILAQQGRRAQKWNWAKLRDRLLSGAYPGLREQVQSIPYLALDDIGAEYTESGKTAALSASLLYDILEARLGKWTLITSNLKPADMVDVRITSRLYRGLNELVDMSGAGDFCYMLQKGGGKGLKLPPVLTSEPSGQEVPPAVQQPASDEDVAQIFSEIHKTLDHVQRG